MSPSLATTEERLVIELGFYGRFASQSNFYTRLLINPVLSAILYQLWHVLNGTNANINP